MSKSKRKSKRNDDGNDGNYGKVKTVGRYPSYNSLSMRGMLHVYYLTVVQKDRIRVAKKFMDMWIKNFESVTEKIAGEVRSYLGVKEGYVDFYDNCAVMVDQFPIPGIRRKTNSKSNSKSMTKNNKSSRKRS